MPIYIQNAPPEGWKNPEDRLAFKEWGEQSPSLGYLPTISIFSRHYAGLLGPMPCPACDHPTGDCADHVTATAADTNGGPMNRTTSTQGTDAANEDPNSNLFVVPDDVIEVFTPLGSSRPSKRLVARAGETISRERAIQLGLVEGTIPRQAIPNAEIVTKEGVPVSDMVAT